MREVREVRPVFLKSISRIEAFLFLEFVAVILDAVIEREIRVAMKRARITKLPLYPEERECAAPTAGTDLRAVREPSASPAEGWIADREDVSARPVAGAEEGPWLARYPGCEVPPKARLTALADAFRWREILKA